MDPTRFNEWVTIHRKIGDVDDGPRARGLPASSSGWRCAARRSPCTGRSTECDAPSLGVWEGKGPARLLRARRQPAGAERQRRDALRVRERRSRRPAARWARLASRVLVGGMPKREADKSLKKLKKLLES